MEAEIPRRAQDGGVMNVVDAAALFALAEMKNDTCRYGKAAWR